MDVTDRAADLARRLSSLPPEAQERELARLERLIAQQAKQDRLRTLAKHQPGLVAATVEAVLAYCQKQGLHTDRILPITVGLASGPDGKLTGTLHDPRRDVGTRTRGPGFLREHGVVAIELNGKKIEKCAESEVLRVAYGTETGKQVYGRSSPHTTAMRPESQKLIREMGFVAVSSDGTRKPLADLYTAAPRRRRRERPSS